MLAKISFIICFFALLWFKNIEYLLLSLVIIYMLAYKDFFKLNKKVLKSILFFNLGVSLGYIVMALYENISPLHYILYINLKVYTLTFFVFWFFSKISIIEFFAFSKDMSYLLTITLSQIYSYKKAYEDFSLAYKARFIKNYRLRKNDFIKVVFRFFLRKSMNDSEQRVMAMRARGFFD